MRFDGARDAVAPGGPACPLLRLHLGSSRNAVNWEALNHIGERPCRVCGRWCHAPLR